MYRRLSSIMFPIMTIAFIGALFWGYQEQQEKKAVLLKAENGYQRAFGDLAYYVHKLNDELGNTLAVNSSSMDYQRKGLVNVWRITSEAQHAVSQLPVSYIPFAKAENFLSRLSNFAYKTAVRDLSKQPLNDQEFKTLKSLYESSDQISSQLSELQNNIMTSSIRWMDVELALAMKEEDLANHPVISSLRTVNDDSGKYSEVDWGPAVNSMYTDKTLKMLSGKRITKEEAAQKAAEFVQTNASNIDIKENGQDSDYPTYTAIVKDDEDGDKKLTITAKGGQLVSYTHYRNVEGGKLSIEQARSKASQFIKDHGYKDMQVVSYDEYEHTGTLTYVQQVAGDTLIYPDKIVVKIALDDGEVVGFYATEYVSNHHNREMNKPSISLNEAIAAINPDLTIQDQKMAVIVGELGEEVLCYEFTGTLNNKLYRVYINSQTGLEETIELMTRADKQVSS